MQQRRRLKRQQKDLLQQHREHSQQQRQPQKKKADFLPSDLPNAIGLVPSSNNGVWHAGKVGDSEQQQQQLHLLLQQQQQQQQQGQQPLQLQQQLLLEQKQQQPLPLQQQQEREHHHQQQQRLRCPLCPLEEPNARRMKSHLSRVHYKRQLIKLAKSSSSSASSLKTGPPFPCPQCHAKLDSTVKLAGHLGAKHDQVVQFLPEEIK